MKVRDEHGRELDATFSVEPFDSELTIVWESRGGTRGTPTQVNSEYGPGLDLLLARLRSKRLTISDIRLHSKKKPLGSSVIPPKYPRPLHLDTVNDVVALRHAIGAVTEKTDRSKNALARAHESTGNRTKRLRIYLDASAGSDAAKLERELSGPSPRRYWALFASPKVYRIDDAVAELAEDTWTTKGKAIRAGDRGLIWRGAGGGEAARGIVAFVEIVSDPKLVEDSKNPYWRKPDEVRADSELRVRTRYVLAPRLPLLEDGEEKEMLGSLPVAKARGGTVFEVDAEVFESIVKAAGGWPELPDPAGALEALSDLNARDQGDPPARRARGQGYGLTKPERDAVEALAMRAATKHFEDEKWHVEDVSKCRSYDLVCRKGITELRVEVKGTTGRGKVLLTKNEVEHARKQYPHVALFVLSEIKLKKGTPPACEGGEVLILHPWQIDDSALVAVGFEYDVKRGA